MPTTFTEKTIKEARKESTKKALPSNTRSEVNETGNGDYRNHLKVHSDKPGREYDKRFNHFPVIVSGGMHQPVEAP